MWNSSVRQVSNIYFFGPFVGLMVSLIVLKRSMQHKRVRAEWTGMSNHRLFHWASTIKNPTTIIVLVKYNRINCNLFSPWYSFKIAHLVLKNNHSFLYFLRQSVFEKSFKQTSIHVLNSLPQEVIIVTIVNWIFVEFKCSKCTFYWNCD
jgi:hypothetical protein